MTLLAVLTFLKRYYGPMAVVALLGLVVFSLHEHDAREREIGQVQQQQRDAAASIASLTKANKALDDTIAKLDNQLDAMHADYEQQLGLLTHSLQRDTLTIERWLHDTVRVASDTTKFAIPAAAILAADSSLKVCRDITSSCAAFRVAATRQHTLDSATIQILRKTPALIPQRSRCGIDLAFGPALVWNGSGGAARIGALLGWGCQW